MVINYPTALVFKGKSACLDCDTFSLYILNIDVDIVSNPSN